MLAAYTKEFDSVNGIGDKGRVQVRHAELILKWATNKCSSLLKAQEQRQLKIPTERDIEIESVNYAGKEGTKEQRKNAVRDFQNGARWYKKQTEELNK